MTIIRRTILFILLLLPNIYAVFYVNDLTLSPLKALAYIIVVAVCLLLPAIILKSKTYFIVEGILSLFCAPIEIASIFLNHETATKSFLSLIYFTNKREVAELLNSLWFIVLIVIVVWIIYFVLASKEQQHWLLPKPLRTAILIALPILFVSGLGVFSVINKRIFPNITTKQAVTNATEALYVKFYKIFPYNFYLNSVEVFRDEYLIHEQLKLSESFSFGITPKTDSISEIVVLVIGETARSCNFSINGYNRPTTPHLSMRRNVISYKNAYSQANLTSSAVPHILSRISINDRSNLYTEKNLVDAFKEAGFNNAWISAKSANAFTTRIIKTIDFHYQSTKGLSSIDKYDMTLLEYVDKSLEVLKSNKKMLVLHTMGSHWRYDSRYPEEFDVFKPSMDKNFNLAKLNESTKQELLNSYDNSLLYTDYFLDSLATKLDALNIPAIILYLSDHGENLYDDDRKLVLHGSYEGTRYEYNIPFIIWYSEEYEQRYPDKVTTLRNNQEQQFNSSVVFHTLLDAVGIEQGITPSKSLCNPLFCSMDTMYAITGNETLIRITADTIIRN